MTHAHILFVCLYMHIYIYIYYVYLWSQTQIVVLTLLLDFESLSLISFVMCAFTCKGDQYGCAVLAGIMYITHVCICT